MISLFLLVACPKGTFYLEKVVKCTPCPQGSYQDEEGRLICKLCGKGKTTLERGSKSKEECVNRGNNTEMKNAIHILDYEKNSSRQ